MTSRSLTAAPAHPLWQNLGTAVRQTLRNLSAPAASPSAFEELEGEQARIRRSSRMWLVG